MALHKGGCFSEVGCVIRRHRGWIEDEYRMIGGTPGEVRSISGGATKEPRRKRGVSLEHERRMCEGTPEERREKTGGEGREADGTLERWNVQMRRLAGLRREEKSAVGYYAEIAGEKMRGIGAVADQVSRGL
jgi:hypothetical protein